MNANHLILINVINFNLGINLMNINGIIVGGTYNSCFSFGKNSSIIAKLASCFENFDIINGSEIFDTEYNNDLIIWMPNISNSIEKIYPKKKKGSVLICSKVLRYESDIEKGYGEALNRIYKMHANAVILINKFSEKFKFSLLDALGNIWIETSNLEDLAKTINKFYCWSASSIRKDSTPLNMSRLKYFNESNLSIDRLCEIVHTVSDKVESQRGGRYFGNVSTRCSYMFPSARSDYDSIIVSSRNSPKNKISINDFVIAKLIDNNVFYNEGSNKPSVDTPIQLYLYKMFDDINFMIHGHAYIEDVLMTEDYYPCGDLRELKSILEHFLTGTRVINLKNHGFLIAAKDIFDLKRKVDNSNFIFRKIK